MAIKRLFLVAYVFLNIFNSSQAVCLDLFQENTAEIEFTVPEPLQRYIDHRSVEQRASFESLVGLLRTIPYTTMEESLQKSELSLDTIENLKKFGKEVITIKELLARGNIATGYSLGLSSFHGQYEMLSERFILDAWADAYRDFNIDWNKVKNHTHIFMNKIIDSSKPIYFFVPNSVRTHPKAGVTKAEFDWLLKRTQSLKNVTFVFGSYDIVTLEMEELREKSTISQSQFRALIMRALGATSSSWENDI